MKAAGTGLVFRQFEGRLLGVATLHGKERVIGPALLQVLPLSGVTAIAGVDTDRFGAFSGEVQRTADPVTTARLKAKHGAEVSGLDLVIASEGSFGPYPPAPLLSCNEEFLALYDAREGTFLEHRHVSLNTVFGGVECTTLAAVRAFADRMRFPDHQLVLKRQQGIGLGDVLIKGIGDHERLLEMAEGLIADQGSCWVETDMRAMANPTRMAVIAETAERFAQELSTTCPACGTCWFRITDALPGLPCGLCAWPTQSTRAHRRTCRACGHSMEVPRTDGKVHEDPGHCDRCNP